MVFCRSELWAELAEGLLMSFQIDDHSPREGVAVIAVRGDLDVYTSPKMREAIMEVLNRGLSRLVVDLNQTVSLDSTALGVLIGGKKRAVEKGGDLKVVCPSQRTRRIFALTSLDRIFEIYDTQEDAVAAY